MKVLCVDAKPRKLINASALKVLGLLSEGKEYEVEFEVRGTYKLVGIENPPNITANSPYPTFQKSRFIPISNIDETELIRKREEMPETV